MREDLRSVERYLHEHIPITRALGVSVLGADADGVRLGAPFGPNINHRSTVFGGSVSTLAILSGWTLVQLRLRAERLRAQIVIQRNTMEYLLPMRADFEAFCPSPPADEWRRFLQTLRRRGRARIEVEAEIISAGERAGTFRGVYAALRAAPTGA